MHVCLIVFVTCIQRCSETPFIRWGAFLSFEQLLLKLKWLRKTGGQLSCFTDLMTTFLVISKMFGRVAPPKSLKTHHWLHACLFVHLCVCVCLCASVCLRVSLCACVFACVCGFACVFVRLCVCVCLCAPVCLRASLCACVFACIFVRLCVCVHLCAPVY